MVKTKNGAQLLIKASAALRTEVHAGRQDLVKGMFAFVLPACLYNLALLDRKLSLITGTAPFLLDVHLRRGEVALFIVLFCAEAMTVLATIWTCCMAVLRRFTCVGKPVPLVVIAILACVYMSVITMQFEALKFFHDGIDLTVARNLAGGGILSALSYARNELVGTLPILAAGALVTMLGCLSLNRLHLSRFQLRTARVASHLGGRTLAGANIFLLIVSGITFWSVPNIGRALAYSPFHALYASVLERLTDFDGDGYGLMRMPLDFAPFDSSRHPYALDVPGNGIDEDGIGGDLPAATVWKRPNLDWARPGLLKQNVVIVILESAREGLLNARTHSGAMVMPTLHDTPGTVFTAISPAGFTSTAVKAILNGTTSDEEEGISLIRRFGDLGYSTAVFSGQHEGHGGISQSTAMTTADVFRDATAYPSSARLYTGNSTGSLCVPGRLVNASFKQWLDTADHSRLFFAYINYQEMHFPYYYVGAPLLVTEHPLERRQITFERRDELIETYYNAARQVDSNLADLLETLRSHKQFDNTIILIVGDHGEELFDNGYLGHGTNISYEQYATLAKLLNTSLPPQQSVVTQADVGVILYNALRPAGAGAVALAPEAFCYKGAVNTPRQIGVFTKNGLSRYDFLSGEWTSQSRAGAAFVRIAAQPSLVHMWESYKWRNAQKNR